MFDQRKMVFRVDPRDALQIPGPPSAAAIKPNSERTDSDADAR